MARLSTYKRCARARVAIDVPALGGLTAANYYTAACEQQVHIGHARTVLLGSLIAEELGLPFHIRLDGPWRPGESMDRGILFCLISVVSRLNIRCDKAYWQPHTSPPATEYERVFGERGRKLYEMAWAMTDAKDEALGVLADDLLHHHPSLYIRGMEFAEGWTGHSPGGGPTGTTARYLARERLLFEAVGIEKQEINVPLIYDEGHKVSKSLHPRLSWSAFQEADGPALRSFLLATAINPSDPIGALDEPFSLKTMTSEPFHWNPEVWTEYTSRPKRRTGG